MKQVIAVPVQTGTPGRINPAEVPAHIRDTLAQTVFEEMLKEKREARASH